MRRDGAAMFSNKKSDPSTTDTFIGQDSIVEGKVISKASLRIEGHIIGDVECLGDVALGKEAVVRSNIKARNVFNSGTVHGSITSKGTLSIANSGKMYGDISVGSLTISEGGIFQGSSMMDSDFKGTPEKSTEVNNIKPRLRSVESNTEATK